MRHRPRPSLRSISVLGMVQERLRCWAWYRRDGRASKRQKGEAEAKVPNHEVNRLRNHWRKTRGNSEPNWHQSHRQEICDPARRASLSLYVLPEPPIRYQTPECKNSNGGTDTIGAASSYCTFPSTQHLMIARDHHVSVAITRRKICPRQNTRCEDAVLLYNLRVARS